MHVIQPVAFLLPAEHVHGGADEGRGLAVALGRHVARDAELGPAEAVVSSCRRRYGTRVLELSSVVIRGTKLVTGGCFDLAYALVSKEYVSA